MTIAIVPQPALVDELPGYFHLVPDARIGASAEATPLAWLLHDALRGSGHRLAVVCAEDPAAVIRLGIDRAIDDSAEAYRLVVSPERVELVGATAAGLARGVQTLRQLLPAHALRTTAVGRDPVSIPCCRVQDAPRFEWRGVHLDVARHFMPKSFVLQLIDAAALHRLNVLHLHLTDDQGWRLEVPGHPRLTEVGGWRTETVIGADPVAPKTFDGTPHGGFYSIDDLREIVAYAADRHITVVPEVDVPGHVRAVLAAYPHLGVTGETVQTARHFGIFDDVLAPTDAAMAFARDVLEVVLDVFPSRFVHLGGDECPRTQWRNSPLIAKRAADLGLASVDELQSWYLRELTGYLTDRGRRMVGWDEVIEDGGVPTDAVVMAWRGMENARLALKAGHDVVMTPHQRTYFDKYQVRHPDEPLAQAGVVSLRDVMTFDPCPPDLPDAGRVLGVQGQLWTEYMPTPQTVQYMAFPRLCALAEVAWTQPERRSVDGLLARLPAHLRRLDALGLDYRPLAGPRPWQTGGTGRRQGRPQDPGY
ncbi:beta-N-acetylhexosaminidase [Micromonospora sp. NPDC048830]|uniref:beta-N-acetylhexosaminidase n=1 Tax=Micromonospora sp. NPDC048830 TaxID=3364257 RepID=UPI00371FDFE4